MSTWLDFASSNLTPPGQRTKSPHQSNGDLPWGTNPGDPGSGIYALCIRGRVVGSNIFLRPFISKS